MKNKYFSQSVSISSFLRLPFILLFVLFLPANLFSQITRTINFPINTFSLTGKTAADSNVYLHVSLSSLHWSSEAGKPRLPVKYLKFLLPPNTRVKDITISSFTKTTRNIDHKIFPAQLPEPTSIISGVPKFIPPDKDIYGSSNPYPANIVQVAGDSYFDGDNHIVTISIYPVQYFPLSNRIEFNTDISFSLVLESYTSNIAVMPKSRAIEDQKTYDNILKAVVDNPEDIPTYQTKPLIMGKESAIQNQTAVQSAVPFYKYVIVTTNSMKNSFNKFIDWKKEKELI